MAAEAKGSFVPASKVLSNFSSSLFNVAILAEAALVGHDCGLLNSILASK
jgi:hypothetical protein